MLSSQARDELSRPPSPQPHTSRSPHWRNRSIPNTADDIHECRLCLPTGWPPARPHSLTFGPSTRTWGLVTSCGHRGHNECSRYSTWCNWCDMGLLRSSLRLAHIPHTVHSGYPDRQTPYTCIYSSTFDRHKTHNLLGLSVLWPIRYGLKAIRTYFSTVLSESTGSVKNQNQNHHRLLCQLRSPLILL